MIIAGALQIDTPTDNEIVMTRIFNAPRSRVFEALTKPELLKRWNYGPEGWSLPICEVDLQVGGAYRYVWRHEAKGKQMEMGGVYREIVPPERLVATEIFKDAWYSGEALGTYTLVEERGNTTLTLAMLYESKDVRDAVLNSGMERGVAAGFDRLEAIVAAA